MALLGYQKWKADKVESGECRQTIRAERRHTVKVGEVLHHYCGLRQAGCRKLRAHLVDRCTETFPISLSFTGRGEPVWLIRGCVAMKPELEEIARRDGFECVLEMSQWFFHNHIAKSESRVFVGNVIRW